MPRPVDERKTVVAPVPIQQEPTQQLGVFAPMDVRAPQTSSFSGLAQALGVLAPVATGALAQRADATTKADAAEGQADAELAQVDPERVKQSRAYADAAHQVEITKQYQQAQSTVEEWAATNLDATKPFTEQTAAIDARMKQELGGLAKDPRAAAIIAPRYQKFIEGASNAIVSRQVEARANEALATAQADVASDLQAGGDGRYAEQVAHLTPLLGDRTKAVQAVVGMYIDHAHDVAAKGGDWKAVYAALPSDITLPDGTKIPGPARSPALHDAIVRGKAAAQQAFNAYAEPIRAQQQLHVLTQLENMASHGGMITEAMIKPYILPGPNGEPPLLSADRGASLITQASNKREQLAKEHTVRTNFLVPDWQRYLNQVDPTDPKGQRKLTQGDFQTAYDQQLGMATNGFADVQDTATKAVALTKQVGGGLVSSTLKAQLTGAASRTTPAEAVKMLPAFQTLQAAGQLPAYLSPEQIAFYNNIAIQVSQNQGNGASSVEALTQAASRYEPSQVKAMVDDQLPEARKQFDSINTDAPWYTIGVKKNLADYATPAQVWAIAEPLMRKTLADNGGNVAKAVQAVKRTIVDSYAPVTIQGQKVLMPLHGQYADPEVLQEQLDFISDELVPKMAKAAGLTKEESADLAWQVSQLPGQVPELVVIHKTTGVEVPQIKPVTLSSALAEGAPLRRKQMDTEARAAAERDKHPLPGQGTPLYMQH